MKIPVWAISAAALATMVASPALACNGEGNCENAPGQQNNPGRGHGVHGAPGPLVGAAGFPILAAGYGVYWLVRRRRKQADA